MRASNLVVSGFGLIGILVGAWMSWRWRNLSLVQPAGAVAHDYRSRFGQALRSTGAALSGGLIAGLLVMGLGGRLVMRVAAAMSGDGAQGRGTEAGEIVGEITFDGTVGFIAFIGLGAGVIATAAYLLVRRWLPDRAGPAGLVGAVLLAGTLGIADPINPDNIDFAVLSPQWVVVVLVVGTGVLFATTLTAVAARLEQTIRQPGRRGWLPAAPLIFVVIPPFTIALAYVAVRTFAGERIDAVLGRATVERAGYVVVGVAALVCGALTVRAVTEILG